MSRILLSLLLAMAGFALAACSPSDQKESTSRSLEERVIVAATPFTSSTGEVTILWDFRLADRWHLYAPQRNDSGYPPTIKLTLPDGWAAEPLSWPVPERHLAAGDILDHVYHDQLLLLQDLTPPASAEPGEVLTLQARLDWLICHDICVPGHKELDLEVTIGTMAMTDDVSNQVARARAALPGAAPTQGYSLTWHDSTVEIVVPDAVALEFYPDEDCALLADVVNDAVGDSNRLELKLRTRDGRPGPLKGILHQKLTGDRSRNWLIDQPLGG